MFNTIFYAHVYSRILTVYEMLYTCLSVITIVIGANIDRHDGENSKGTSRTL
jgi:hypothetical protein